MVLRRFSRHRLAVVGAVVVIVLILSALAAPILAPRDPIFNDVYKRFTPPLQQGFLLGSDEVGRDELSRLLYAGRVSLTVGFAAMLVTVLVGSLVGAIAGYYTGPIDNTLMRITDVMLSFPTIYLLLALAAFVPPSVATITLIIAITAWMTVARIVRGQILAIKEQDYILAARSMGAGDWRIIFRHCLPNGLAPILVAATLNVANAVLMESYISYLGYGIQPPTASWGNMLNNAQTYFQTAPWVAIFPGVVITATVMSFNFLGDGLRDALDPRLKME
ncbi:MAG: ABC transporter permease [Chloroflexi bacterium]|nr:ABC transporter permease [Chloroflexota bacterium]